MDLHPAGAIDLNGRVFIGVELIVGDEDGV